MGKKLILMFLGTYYHTLENNGRFSLPKQFRLQKITWVVTRGIDGGLLLMSKDHFAEELGQVSERTFTLKKQRDFLRFVASSAQEVQPDKVGRIQLPEYLIKLAKLEKNIVIVGNAHHIEIWNQEEYHKYYDALQPPEDEVLEKKI